MQSPEEILSFYLPYMIRAGAYALAIQDQVASHSDKASSDTNLISEALTDADLSVQGFFEVVTLGRFPELCFFGEEYERSMNAKYFPDTSPLKIYLDPINGTKLYQDKSGRFDIVLSILREERVVGAVTYIPQDETFYLATEDGAYTTTAEAVVTGQPWQDYTLPVGAETIVIYEALPEERRAFKAEFESVFEIDKDYDPGIQNHAIHSILLGRAAGHLRRNGSIIDWGALSYIAAQAGGVLVDYEGRSIAENWTMVNNRFPSLLCARDEATATRILKVLASVGGS